MLMLRITCIVMIFVILLSFVSSLSGAYISDAEDARSAGLSSSQIKLSNYWLYGNLITLLVSSILVLAQKHSGWWLCVSIFVITITNRVRLVLTPLFGRKAGLELDDLLSILVVLLLLIIFLRSPPWKWQGTT